MTDNRDNKLDDALSDILPEEESRKKKKAPYGHNMPTYSKEELDELYHPKPITDKEVNEEFKIACKNFNIACKNFHRIFIVLIFSLVVGILILMKLMTY